MYRVYERYDMMKIDDRADRLFDRSPIGMTYWNVQV